ncbi:hypothetical protein GCM10027347_61540 [Larkinella harenae]
MSMDSKQFAKLKPATKVIVDMAMVQQLKLRLPVEAFRFLNATRSSSELLEPGLVAGYPALRMVDIYVRGRTYSVPAEALEKWRTGKS